jgi:hypothetical protein
MKGSQLWQGAKDEGVADGGLNLYGDLFGEEDIMTRFHQVCHKDPGDPPTWSANCRISTRRVQLRYPLTIDFR